MAANFDSLKDVLDEKTDKQTFEEYKQQLVDLLDESTAKMNEIDCRVSTLEEKDLKSIITEEDKPE